MRCGGCGREIHEERTSCLYCGWTKKEGRNAATAARPAPGNIEPTTYRAGATTWRFLAWAALAVIAAGVLLQEPELTGRDRLYGIALVILGPLAFLAQLFRVMTVHVTLDPREGIILRNRRVIRWTEMERIERAGLRLALDQALIRSLLDMIAALGTHVGTGFTGMMNILLIGLLGLLVGAVGLVGGVLLPVFLLLSPLQPRIDLHLADGGKVALRDLTHETDFLLRVESRIKQKD